MNAETICRERQQRKKRKVKQKEKIIIEKKN